MCGRDARHPGTCDLNLRAVARDKVNPSGYSQSWVYLSVSAGMRRYEMMLHWERCVECALVRRLLDYCLLFSNEAATAYHSYINGNISGIVSLSTQPSYSSSFYRTVQLSSLHHEVLDHHSQRSVAHNVCHCISSHRTPRSSSCCPSCGTSWPYQPSSR